MNLVLFEQHELFASQVTLSDRRGDHIRTILRLVAGDTLRVGMVNGDLGQGRIVQINEREVTLEVELNQPPPPVPAVTLILALPRPIMLQRILKQATVLGVNQFHLIRSAKVEKSFFHSPALQPEKIKARLLEGLEQAVDTRLPSVTIHHRFKPFVEDIVPGLHGQGIIAHPGQVKKITEIIPLSTQTDSNTPENILLAVGPEGGWNKFELNCFVRQGFAAFSMGSRILHVDTAVVALLAQLNLLLDVQDSFALPGEQN